MCFLLVLPMCPFSAFRSFYGPAVKCTPKKHSFSDSRGSSAKCLDGVRTRPSLCVFFGNSLLGKLSSFGSRVKKMISHSGP